MSFNIGGIPVNGVIVNSIETGKSKAEEVIKSQIQEALSNPAKNIKELQQPSGLSVFLDIKV